MDRPVIFRIFLSAAAVSAFAAISLQSQPAQAFNMKACVKERSFLQCQCDSAIDIGTKAALKKFIVTYGRTKTACNAAASTLGIKVPAKPTTAGVKAATARTKNNNGFGNGDEGNCTGGGCADSSNPGGGGSGGGGNGGGGNGGGGNGNK